MSGSIVKLGLPEQVEALNERAYALTLENSALEAHVAERDEIIHRMASEIMKLRMKNAALTKLTDDLIAANSSVDHHASVADCEAHATVHPVRAATARPGRTPAGSDGATARPGRAPAGAGAPGRR